MRNLVLNSLLILLVSGCSSSHLNNFQRIPETFAGRDSINSWFRGDTNRYLFRTHVDIYGNHFGGLMLIKPVNGKDYRVLFITEVGIKIFDMEFLSNGEFKLHYCMDALNRRSVIQTLKNDMDMLLNPLPENSRITMMKDRHTGKILIKSKDKSTVKYVFLEGSSRVNKIVQKNGCAKKVELSIYCNDSNDIDSVRICHSPVSLNIFLSKLNENKSEISE